LAEGSRREDQLKAFDLDYGWGHKWDNAAQVRKQWEKMHDERPRGGARFIRFIDNHDIANDSYDNRIEKAWGGRRVEAALVAIFTLDGVPMLYNGQEVADTARHSIFGRLPIDWARGDTPIGRARRAFCTKLGAMRHTERALTHGAVVWLDNDRPDAVLSFLRRVPGEEILSVVNLSDRAANVHLALSEPTRWTHVIRMAEGAKVETHDGGFCLSLGSFGYLAARKK
jgi:cyclomaltodextrinase / maltogenic alpha-amylase / neopullulanase